MTVFSFIADLLSVVGFLITIYVALRVRSIRKEYLLLGRAPNQAAQLQQRADELVPLLNDVEKNQQELLKVLASVEVSLDSLRASLRGRLLQTNKRLFDDVCRLQGLPVHFKWLRRSVLSTKVENLSQSELRTVYTEITKLVSKIGEERENQNWMR